MRYTSDFVLTLLAFLFYTHTSFCFLLCLHIQIDLCRVGWGDWENRALWTMPTKVRLRPYIVRLKRQKRKWICRKQNSKIYPWDVASPMRVIHQIRASGWICREGLTRNKPCWLKSADEEKNNDSKIIVDHKLMSCIFNDFSQASYKDLIY